MENQPRYFGVNFTTLRIALFLMFFGEDNGNWKDLSSPKYKYIIPMRGNFENPIEDKELNKDTYIQYWIEKDESLTQDDYVIIDGVGYNRQKCVASVLIRTVGKQAETWIKAFRHLTKRNGVEEIWSGMCNAEKLEYTSPIRPVKVYFSGMNSEIGFDVRFKLYYDECIRTGWLPLEGVNFKIESIIRTDDEDVEA